MWNILLELKVLEQHTNSLILVFILKVLFRALAVNSSIRWLRFAMRCIAPRCGGQE